MAEPRADSSCGEELHTARKPLAVIVAYAEILVDGLAGPIPEGHREYLETILERALELDQWLVGAFEAR